MNEQLVSFEVAQLLKAKGFKCECASTYRIGDNIFKEELLESDGELIYLLEDYGPLNFYYNQHVDYASAPTQSLAQKWLREVHNIHISVWFNTLTEKYRPESPNDNLDFIMGNNGEFKTYEEALEFSLKQALILIKDELNNN